MIHGAQKIIVAVPLTQILPRPPGFHTFPQSRLLRALVVPFERQDHGNVQKPPPPKITPRGRFGSQIIDS